MLDVAGSSLALPTTLPTTVYKASSCNDKSIGRVMPAKADTERLFHKHDENLLSANLAKAICDHWWRSKRTTCMITTGCTPVANCTLRVSSIRALGHSLNSCDGCCAHAPPGELPVGCTPVTGVDVTQYREWCLGTRPAYCCALKLATRPPKRISRAAYVGAERQRYSRSQTITPSHTSNHRCTSWGAPAPRFFICSSMRGLGRSPRPPTTQQTPASRAASREGYSSPMRSSWRSWWDVLTQMRWEWP